MTVVRVSSEERDKQRRDAEKRIKDAGERLRRTRKRLKEYIRA